MFSNKRRALRNSINFRLNFPNGLGHTGIQP